MKAQPDTPDDGPLLHPNRRANPTAKRPKAPRRDADLLLEMAWEQGCDIQPTKKGHYTVYTPDEKSIIVVPGTPSDHRGLRNVRSLFRQAGLNISRK